MADAMISIMGLLILSLTMLPLIYMTWLTFSRIRNYTQSGRTLRFQYRITDILAATMSLAIVVTSLYQIFGGPDFLQTVAVYFIAAAAVGSVVGKIWHLTTIDNSWRNGALYIAIGTALWTTAAIGPVLTKIWPIFLNMPNC